MDQEISLIVCLLDVKNIYGLLRHTLVISTLFHQTKMPDKSELTVVSREIRLKPVFLCRKEVDNTCHFLLNP